jgi:hypothetical protein
VKLIKYSAVLSLLIFFSGCNLPHPPLPYDPGNPLKRIAILPMKNDTSDVDGPDIVRQKMAAALTNRSYVVKDMKETDQILRDQMGINLGGQLDMTTAQKLGETLEVEGVLYGTLMDFDETTTGILNVKKVRGKFKLVNTQTGQVVWTRGLGVRNEVRMSGNAGVAASAVAKVSNAREKEAPWVTIGSTTSGSDNVGKSFVAGLGSKLFMKAIGKHLDYESTDLARRVTDNLGWGPGTAVAAAPAASAPKFNMPAMKAPEPPSFGYMEHGKGDFTALMVSTTVNKGKSDTMLMEATIAKAGEKFRSDMDISKMAKGQQSMPPELSRMVVISRGDKHESYTLYPGKKKFMTHPQTENDGEKPKIEKIKVGSETIDGHLTDKYKVRITNRDGKVNEGFMWNATDLEGMTIRTETENNDFKMTTELKNIVLKRPQASLFDVPVDYTEASNFMELMMPEKKD